tara:strand:+ start:6597 stop:7502 length:906 start_codon:yes stop_codon:yes gene_type:complete
MISFIIPFMTVEKDKFLNLNEGFEYSDSTNVVYSTIKTIKNINSLKCEKEILLIDNSHTWPEMKLPNVRVIKGWQAIPLEELKKIPEFMNHKDIQLSLDNFGNDTMWASMAFHLGIQESKGDYVVLQHNDTFYHKDCIDEMIEQMEVEELEYITVDNKKIWISTYLLNKNFLDKYIKDYSQQQVLIRPENGGYVKTKKIGLSDAYFFLSKRSFFDNYSVDWYYGDTNHGATIYCLHHNLKYLHLGPYYDNPNWKTDNTLHTYNYKDEPFLTHLKGGFSENKMSSKDFEVEFQNYLKELKNN